MGRPLRILLTERQIRDLMPFKDRVQAAAVRGSPGMLVAQIGWNSIDGRWWMTPGFLEHEHAKLITKKGHSA